MSATTIRELITKFGFDVDLKPLEDLETGVSTAKAGLIGLTATLGAAALGIFALVKSTADIGDAALFASKKLGVEIQALQELQFMAKFANLSNEELGLSLQFLNRNMAAAAKDGGSELAKSFHRVGISQAALASGTLKADRALQIISKNFQTLPEGAQRTAVSMELFGRSGAKMIPFLGELAGGMTDVQRAVFEMNVMTLEQAEASDRFNDALDLSLFAIKGITKAVGLGLMPVVTDIVEGFAAWIAENKTLLKDNLTGFVKGLAAAAKIAWKTIMVLTDSLAGFTSAMGGAELATKLLLGTLTLVSGAAILFGIGKLVQGIYGIATAFTVANAAALLIPLAIGLAVVAVGLLIDDVVAFFQGRGSITKYIVDFFGTTLPDLLMRAASAVTGWLTGQMSEFTAWFQKFMAPIHAFIDGITAKMHKLGINVSSGINSGLSAIGLAPQTSPAATAVSQMSSNVRDTGSLLGVTPDSRSSGTTNNSSSQQVSVSAPITVTVPPSLGPVEAAEAVERGVQGGLGAVLRQASRATSGGVRQ